MEIIKSIYFNKLSNFYNLLKKYDKLNIYLPVDIKICILQYYFNYIKNISSKNISNRAKNLIFTEHNKYIHIYETFYDEDIDYDGPENTIWNLYIIKFKYNQLMIYHYNWNEWHYDVNGNEHKKYKLKEKYEKLII